MLCGAFALLLLSVYLRKLLHIAEDASGLSPSDRARVEAERASEGFTIECAKCKAPLKPEWPRCPGCQEPNPQIDGDVGTLQHTPDAEDGEDLRIAIAPVEVERRIKKSDQVPRDAGSHNAEEPDADAATPAANPPADLQRNRSIRLPPVPGAAPRPASPGTPDEPEAPTHGGRLPPPI
jgi:hypothetical protein